MILLEKKVKEVNLYISSAYIYCPYALNICLIIILEQTKELKILHETTADTKIKMDELMKLNQGNIKICKVTLKMKAVKTQVKGFIY